MTRAILVCGATGKQGGAVINHLVEQNADFEILAVTRDATSGSAQRLLKKSSKIRLIQGNLADPTALFKTAQEVASSPIWGVFSVQVTAKLPPLHNSWIFLFPFCDNNARY